MYSLRQAAGSGFETKISFYMHENVNFLEYFCFGKQISCLVLSDTVLKLYCENVRKYLIL